MVEHALTCLHVDLLFLLCLGDDDFFIFLELIVLKELSSLLLQGNQLCIQSKSGVLLYYSKQVDEVLKGDHSVMV